MSVEYVPAVSNGSMLDAPFTDIFNNSTTTTPSGLVDELENFRNVRRICNSIVLPCILCFGILGNILNIGILCQRRFHKASDKMERCAAHGFLFLAGSDLLFCVVGLPSAFLEQRFLAPTSDAVQIIELFYTAYRTGLLNVFLFSSTWCTVIIALERYLVVMHPLKARACVRLRRTVIYQSVIVVASILCNVPHFLKFKFYRTTMDNETLLVLHSSAIANLHFFKEPYNILWNIFGAFIPMIVLCYCYIHLLIAIYRSRALGMIQLDKYVTSKITLILVLIVTLYFVLVCPSVILTFHAELYAESISPHDNRYNYYTALVISNQLQAMNFAINFLLYFSVNPKFRAYLRCAACRPARAHSSPIRRYEVIHLRVR